MTALLFKNDQNIMRVPNGDLQRQVCDEQIFQSVSGQE